MKTSDSTLSDGGGEGMPLLERDSTPINKFRILAICSAMMGIQFSYTVEFAFVTPQLAELGVPTWAIPFVWLAGPLSGLIVQPVIGVWSDRCLANWGKRRPFIFVGAIFTVLGMLLLAFAETLGHLLSPGNWKLGAIIFTIIGLYVMNFAINVMQGPGRSLIPDLVPEGQQDFANSMCSFMMGVANLVACYLGSIDITKSMPIFPSNFFAMFAIGLLFLIFGVVPTLLFANEGKQDPSKIPPKINVFKSIYAAAKVIPPKLLRACIVYFFAWMGFFPFQIYITDFFGRDVYHGDPTANHHDESYHRYQRGVREGAFAMMLMSGVVLVVSPFQDTVLKFLGLRPTWSIGEFVAGICLSLPLFIIGRTEALIYTSFVGFSFAAFNAVPFTLLSASVDEKKIGIYMGVMNAFAVTAQTLTNFIAGSIFLNIFHKTAYALAVGGFFSFVTMFCVFILRPKDYKKKEEEEEELLDPSI